jgi:hypothetical protein
MHEAKDVVCKSPSEEYRPIGLLSRMESSFVCSTDGDTRIPVMSQFSPAHIEMVDCLTIFCQQLWLRIVEL